MLKGDCRCHTLSLWRRDFMTWRAVLFFYMVYNYVNNKQIQQQAGLSYHKRPLRVGRCDSLLHKAFFDFEHHINHFIQELFSLTQKGIYTEMSSSCMYITITQKWHYYFRSYRSMQYCLYRVYWMRMGTHAGHSTRR